MLLIFGSNIKVLNHITINQMKNIFGFFKQKLSYFKMYLRLFFGKLCTYGVELKLARNDTNHSRSPLPHVNSQKNDYNEKYHCNHRYNKILSSYL